MAQNWFHFNFAPCRILTCLFYFEISSCCLLSHVFLIISPLSFSFWLLSSVLSIVLSLKQCFIFSFIYFYFNGKMSVLSLWYILHTIYFHSVTQERFTLISCSHIEIFITGKTEQSCLLSHPRIIHYFLKIIRNFLKQF